jgi:transcriptional regulator with PAS, ATPase and Fis domain
MGRGSTHSGTLTALTSYNWPGSIRELQGLIERAVILSDDGVLPILCRWHRLGLSPLRVGTDSKGL